MLRAWTLRMTRAAAVGVTYSGELGSFAVGSLPDGAAQDPVRASRTLAEHPGWHVVDITHPTADEAWWTAQLWFADPVDPDWRQSTSMLARQAGVGLARVFNR